MRAIPRQLIILVNDNDELRRCASAALRSAGFALRAYSHAAPALDDLNELRADLIILDWTNPPLDRLPLWRQLRCQHPELPVVYMSAWADEVNELLRVEPVPPAAAVQLPCSLERSLVPTITECLSRKPVAQPCLR